MEFDLNWKMRYLLVYKISRMNIWILLKSSTEKLRVSSLFWMNVIQLIKLKSCVFFYVLFFFWEECDVFTVLKCKNVQLLHRNPPNFGSNERGEIRCIKTLEGRNSFKIIKSKNWELFLNLQNKLSKFRRPNVLIQPKFAALGAVKFWWISEKKCNNCTFLHFKTMDRIKY